MTDSEINKLSQSHSLVPISIDNKYHDGPYLSAMLNLIGENFKSCHILLCDSLYRHTLKLDNKTDLNECIKTASQYGDRWLNKNSRLINNLTIHNKLSRWSEWAENIKSYNDEIKYLCKNNNNFTYSFNASADEFLNRYAKSKMIEINQSSRSICIDYLIEECATIMAIWNEQKYEYLIYPSQPVEAISTTYKYYFNEKNMITWLRPRFIKKQFEVS